jgi:ribulose bisphosphate carboxylase small subunit
MNADIKGALAQINKSWKAFTHKGRPMTKQEVTKVLKYALAKGYETTGELKDDEVDMVIGWHDFLNK